MLHRLNSKLLLNPGLSISQEKVDVINTASQSPQTVRMITNCSLEVVKNEPCSKSCV